MFKIRLMITIGIAVIVAGGALLMQQTEVGEDVFASEKSQSDLAKEAEISESEAQAIALKEVSGDILEQELEEENQSIVYEFEIQTDQHIKEVEVDAKSGEVLNTSIEDDDDEDDDEADVQK